ncbi:hypothetical protein BGZ96_011552 [Linnemannia gamsii]|uniref:Uncharacterized protein n=1 Tax=Linnemannia gamsii TaxID=64522 RepID=A0ABQ7JSQ6_9FUNG|nr:hypothetical protein BGZ96_011552 [Linnemannia gamsii]
MSAPLHIVFEKRLSKKQPAMPSPSVIPQSILIKDGSYFSPPSPSSASTTTKSSSSGGGMFARRGSESSVSSTASSGSHDCFQCGLHTASSSDNDSNTAGHGHGTLSRSVSESSTGSSESLSTPGASNGGRRLRVQWVDRI